jgi:hypothetical protein
METPMASLADTPMRPTWFIRVLVVDEYGEPAAEHIVRLVRYNNGAEIAKGTWSKVLNAQGGQGWGVSPIQNTWGFWLVGSEILKVEGSDELRLRKSDVFPDTVEFDLSQMVVERVAEKVVGNEYVLPVIKIYVDYGG